MGGAGLRSGHDPQYPDRVPAPGAAASAHSAGPPRLCPSSGSSMECSSHPLFINIKQYIFQNIPLEKFMNKQESVLYPSPYVSVLNKSSDFIVLAVNGKIKKLTCNTALLDDILSHIGPSAIFRDVVQAFAGTYPSSARYVEEVGAMNVMFKIGERVVTPSLADGSILPGITRKSCIEMMRSWGMAVEERKISVDELTRAAEDGTLEEAWGTGTAAVISQRERKSVV